MPVYVDWGKRRQIVLDGLAAGKTQAQIAKENLYDLSPGGKIGSAIIAVGTLSRKLKEEGKVPGNEPARPIVATPGAATDWSLEAVAYWLEQMVGLEPGELARRLTPDNIDNARQAVRRAIKGKSGG